MTKIFNGVETHYQHIGKQGEKLLLLHGWGCTWEIWAPIVAQLSEKYQLIIPDLPSFGKSAEPESVWTTDQFVDWLAALVKETIGQEEFAIIGHSFGGKIAAMYAAQRTTQISQLVIVDASGLPDRLSTSKQAQERVMASIPQFFKNIVSEKLKQKFAKITNSSTDYRQATPYQRSILRNLFRENLTQILPHISVPTLVIWGKQDQDTPLHQGKRFQELIPNATLEVFEQSEHFPFLSETAKFIQLIQTFIS